MNRYLTTEIKARLDARITDGIEALFIRIGESDPRDGLRDSPARFIKAMSEMTSGYDDDPAIILERCFDQNFDEVIILRNVEFASLCEHHLLPFIGSASVGYLPKRVVEKPKVVGLSKLARLVDCFARRLQIQERLTTEIADALVKYLDPAGVGVIIKAKHHCMGCRGVMKPEAEMITSIFRGVFRDKPEARAEFLNLLRG